MRDTELLYKYNRTDYKNYKFDQVSKRMIFEFDDRELNLMTISKVIGNIVNFKKRYGKMRIPIILYFSYSGLYIADKISYMMLECICYSIINEFHTKVQILWEPAESIFTLGVKSSPLLLLNNTKMTSVLKFPAKFEKDIYLSHFRRVISGEQEKDSNYLGMLYTEVSSFLKIFDISEEYRDEVAEVVAELVGNACEHTGSDCLVDIDVTSDHSKKEDGKEIEGAYYGINIVIINFSEQLIGADLKKKLIDNQILEKRYSDVMKAYINHQNKFCKSYEEDDFFNVAVFQDKISGREDKISSGGTGLTLLIKTLERQSDTSMCYMISGERVVFFHEHLLDYDEDGWIGFNKLKSFFDDIPDDDCIGRSPVYFPGTAYNLHFVMKREV